MTLNKKPNVTLLYKLSSTWVYVCECRCIHVYNCELTMGMFMHVYVCVHIVAETYLHGIKCRWSDKSGLQLKDLIVVWFRVSGDMLSASIFMFNQWVAKNLKIGMFTPGYRQVEKEKEGKREQTWTDARGLPERHDVGVRSGPKIKQSALVF